MDNNNYFLAVIRDFLSTLTTEISDANEIISMINHDLIGDNTEFYQYKLNQIGSIADEFQEEIQIFKKSNNLEKKKLRTGIKAKGMGKVNIIFRAYNQILEFFIEKTKDESV